MLRECSRECSQKSGCSHECSRECSPGVLSVENNRKSTLESTLGSTRESTPISESTPERTLGSTFRGFSVLGSLAGRQTLTLEALHCFFCFFSSVYVQFSKTRPLKSGESCEKSSGENRVKSCHVCGCHGFFGPDLWAFLEGPFSTQKTAP